MKELLTASGSRAREPASTPFDQGIEVMDFMFPKRTSIWLPLHKVLDEAGERLKPLDATKRVEAYFPELTDEDRQYKTKTGRVRRPSEDVSWVRDALVKEGLMAKRHGTWQISEHGRAYLHAHWDSWVPEYTQQTSETSIEGSEGPGDGDDTPTLPSYWWVNQGQSYKSERNGEYIWAPLQTTRGTTVAHWTRVSEVLPGDIFIHYSNGAIRAIGIAQGEVEERKNPHPGSHNEWQDKGWGVAVRYYELSVPYSRETFPDNLTHMNISDGPFDQRGQVKQGYLWRFTAEAFQILTSDLEFPWPSGIPLDRPDGSSAKASMARESASPYGMAQFDPHAAHRVITEMGYRISMDDFLNVLLALAVRPFVIFSGRSGTGKTTLTRMIASLFGWPYYLVAVSPAWTDPTDLLGFISPLSRQRVGGALDDLLESGVDQALLCLDEFNVAKVEHYFSDFISAMESGLAGSLWGSLPNLPRLSAEQNTPLRLPPRLRVIATMNFDDSVQSITPRVLDRANVLEFDVFGADALVVEQSLDWLKLRETKFQWPWIEERELRDTAVSAMIRNIWPALRGSRGQFTHRVAQEMHRYIALGLSFASALGRNDDEQRESLLDRQIAQRILPKFHGTAVNRDIEALMRLISVLQENELRDSSTVDRLRVIEDFKNWGRYPKTAIKIEQLVVSYTEDGYASFW